MVIISIFTYILTLSLPFIKNSINSVMFRRITAISFIYAGVLSINTLIFQSIGSGIGIYSGFFQVSVLTNTISFFILLISSIILLVWPNVEIVKKNVLATATNAWNSIFESQSSSPSKNKVTSNLVGLKVIETNNYSSAYARISSTPLFETSQLYNNIKNDPKSNEYSLIVLFNILGALFLISSIDLISIYLSIELQSFALYILATLYKEKYTSTSAGLKYFLLGGLSSCIILLGCGLVYSYTGLTDLNSIYSIISVYFNNFSTSSIYENSLNNILNASTQQGNLSVDLNGISLGILLIFIGFLFKIAASPFHNWAPDVYDESPTLVTIWLTIMPKISILILLLELQIGIDLNLNLLSFISNNPAYALNNPNDLSQVFNPLTNLLLLSSLLSLIIGSIVGLSQIKIKRLLAYSTISHIGFLLLALSVLSNSSVSAFIFYIIQYTITNLNIFLIILAFSYLNRTGVDINNKDLNSAPITINIKTSDMEYISVFKGLFYKYPLLSLSFSICLFSFAGVPPLVGFFAKQQVLYCSNSAGYFFLSLVAILVSVISASYYLKIIKILHSQAIITPKPSSTLFTSQENIKHTRQINPKDNHAYAGLTELTCPNIFNNNQASYLAYAPNKIYSEINNILKSNYNSNFIFTLGKHTKSIESKDTFNGNYLTTFHSFMISILTLFILLFILNPELLLNSIAIISSLILNL